CAPRPPDCSASWAVCPRGSPSTSRGTPCRGDPGQEPLSVAAACGGMKTATMGASTPRRQPCVPTCRLAESVRRPRRIGRGAVADRLCEARTQVPRPRPTHPENGRKSQWGAEAGPECCSGTSSLWQSRRPIVAAGVTNPSAGTDWGKADFEAIYNCPDPRRYFSTLGPLDYQIPHHGQGVFRAVAEVLQRRRSDRPPLGVVDLCCSYGVNAALLNHRLSLTDLYSRYAGRAPGAPAADRLAQEDRTFFATRRRPG